MRPNNNTMFSKQSGFTLIEIMISIAIIAILASLATIAYNNYIKNAEVAVIEETISELHHVTKIYVTTHSKLPVSMSQLGVTEAAGLEFKLEPSASNVHEAQIFAYTSDQKIPFVINLSNSYRSLCWDCVPASQAGISSTDAASQFYLPPECRVVNNNNCSSVQSGPTHGSSSVAGQAQSTSNVNANNLPLQQAPAVSFSQQASCSSGEEIIFISGIKACVPKCGAMEVRDPQNLINCIPIPVQQPVFPSCSSTEELVNNQCVAKCAADEYRNLADSSCQSNCSIGQTWKNGACQNISCPIGQKFDPALNRCNNPCGYHEHWLDGVGCCNFHDNRHHNRCP